MQCERERAPQIGCSARPGGAWPAGLRRPVDRGLGEDEAFAVVVVGDDDGVAVGEEFGESECPLRHFEVEHVGDVDECRRVVGAGAVEDVGGADDLRGLLG